MSTRVYTITGLNATWMKVKSDKRKWLPCQFKTGSFCHHTVHIILDKLFLPLKICYKSSVKLKTKVCTPLSSCGLFHLNLTHLTSAFPLYPGCTHTHTDISVSNTLNKQLDEAITSLTEDTHYISP